MAIFIVPWPYLSTTKLRCLQKNTLGTLMYRQPTAAADKMTDMPELHSGQIMWLNPRFLNHFSQDLSVTMCHFWKCKQLFLIACNPFFHTLYFFMILCMKQFIEIEVAFHQSFLTGKTLFQNVI